MEELRARAGVFSFFARLLEQEIDRSLLRQLRGEWAEALAELGFTDAEFFSVPEATLLEAYAEEYTCLMMAPGGCSPFASVFETGRMFQEPADRASAAYAEAGLAFRHQLSGEFPDHIGVMLAFVAQQMWRECEAVTQGDTALAQSTRARWQRFLHQELGGWAIAWARRAAAAAQLPLYQTLCRALEQWLWQELSLLVDRDGLKKLAQLNRRDPPKLDYDADFRKASGL